MKNKSKKITKQNKAAAAAAQREQLQKLQPTKVRAAARNARRNIQAI